MLNIASTVSFDGKSRPKTAKRCSFRKVQTGDERKRMLQVTFGEIRANHVDGRLLVTFKAVPHWEPYVEAVLARKRGDRVGHRPSVKI